MTYTTKRVVWGAILGALWMFCALVLCGAPFSIGIDGAGAYFILCSLSAVFFGSVSAAARSIK